MMDVIMPSIWDEMVAETPLPEPWVPVVWVPFADMVPVEPVAE